MSTRSQRIALWLAASCLVLAFVVVPGADAATDLPPGGSFVDDDGSVHEGFIEAIAAIGITRGCGASNDATFCPEQPVTRAQMAAFLVRALELTETTGTTFVDVPAASTFADDIDRLATSGITRGCGEPDHMTFCPGDPVTRQQMAAFLVRGFGWTTDTPVSFDDVPSGSAAADAIGVLAATGITVGCTADGRRFCPRDTVTRGQMATFLGRALGLSPNTPPPRPSPTRPGNPDGDAPIPVEGRLRDVSQPDRTIGDGTPQSCTSAAVVAAVARGGIIDFDCGPDPVTIPMGATAKVVNDTGPEIVLDGGGTVTLDGLGRHRILYMNTCDPAQTWTTPHCDDQDHPRLTVQNLTFVNGHVDGTDLLAGGGAIFARGGRLTVINSVFRGNTCSPTGPDVGGGAIRVFDQYQDRPVHIVHSTFGGSPASRNTCSNGGALSSIGVSWVLTNSLLTDNRAIGVGANPARSGTPGGGNGGAVAVDGNRFTLEVRATVIRDNHANEGGGAIFFVSNDRTGRLLIDGSSLSGNVSAGFETTGYPGIFYLGDGPPRVANSSLLP